MSQSTTGTAPLKDAGVRRRIAQLVEQLGEVETAKLLCITRQTLGRLLGGLALHANTRLAICTRLEALDEGERLNKAS